MDPSEWPVWLKLVVGWGPLGIGWARAEILRAKAERDHHKTRDAHAAQLAHKDEVHRKQLDLVTDKMIQIVENQSRQAHRLADGVDARRRRKRKEQDDDDEEAPTPKSGDPSDPSA